MAAAEKTVVTPEGLQELEDLLSELKGRAGEKAQKQDAFMLGVYVELLSVVSPLVQKTAARLDREDLASHRRNHKGLRKALKEQSNGASA